MGTQKLFFLLLGCRPEGRFTEQHDILFGAGTTLKDLLPQIKACWPGPHTIHIDAWREVTLVEGYRIELTDRNPVTENQAKKLFFLNLGGYKEKEFEEFHYKMLVVASGKREAIRKAKETAFYKHMGFSGADSHIDDKYGVDVDDIYEINDILPARIKEKYAVSVSSSDHATEDEWHLGYTKLSSLE